MTTTNLTEITGYLKTLIIGVHEKNGGRDERSRPKMGLALDLPETKELMNMQTIWYINTSYSNRDGVGRKRKH